MQVIQAYLLDALAPESPLRLDTPEGRAAAAVVVRVIDVYFAPIMVRSPGLSVHYFSSSRLPNVVCSRSSRLIGLLRRFILLENTLSGCVHAVYTTVTTASSTKASRIAMSLVHPT